MRCILKIIYAANAGITIQIELQEIPRARSFEKYRTASPFTILSILRRFIEDTSTMLTLGYLI
jgi:hypothetical protein